MTITFKEIMETLPKLTKKERADIYATIEMLDSRKGGGANVYTKFQIDLIEKAKEDIQFNLFYSVLYRKLKEGGGAGGQKTVPQNFAYLVRTSPPLARKLYYTFNTFIKPLVRSLVNKASAMEAIEKKDRQRMRARLYHFLLSCVRQRIKDLGIPATLKTYCGRLQDIGALLDFYFPAYTPALLVTVVLNAPVEQHQTQY